MKKIILLLVAFISIVSLTNAQEGINYQAVVRDNNGDLMKNEAVALEFNVLKTSTSGTVVYTETHALSTNNFGNIVAIIGQGTPTLGTYAAIDWGIDKHFLNVKIDGTDMGTTAFLSVPYSEHAFTADELTNPIWKDEFNTVYTEEIPVVIGSNNFNAQALTVDLERVNGEMIDFTVDTITGNSDIINLFANYVEGGTAQFIEMRANGAYYFRFNTDGTLERPGITGDNDMLPIAYGTVNSSGTLVVGSSNVTVTKAATGSYDVTVAGESINTSSYVLMANAVSSSSVNVSPTNVGTDMRVYTRSISTAALVDAKFSFVIYKP